MNIPQRRKHIGSGVVALLSALCCMLTPAYGARVEKKPPGVDAEQYADLMQSEAFDLEDLAEGAEVQRRMFNRMTPPGVSLFQPMFPSVVPFDAANYADSFLDGLLGEDKYSVAVYPLTLILDPKTRETLIYNVEDQLIASIPDSWGPRIKYENSDPARVTLLLNLLPSEDVEPYLYTEARIIQTLESFISKPKSSGISRKSLGSSEFGICNIQKLTNGAMRLTVSNGTGVAEMFAFTVLHTSTVSIVTNEGVVSTNVLWWLASPTYNGVDEPWECRSTNLVFTNGVTIWDDENISSNARQRVYAVARRTDTDSDNLTDGVEFFVQHTNPSVDDTDGDEMTDGWEVENGLNPLIDDGAGNEDGDELSNQQEFLFETNPQDADTDQDGLSDGEEVFAGLDPLYNPLLHSQTEWRFTYDDQNRLTAMTSTAAGVSMDYDDAANLTTISCVEGE